MKAYYLDRPLTEEELQFVFETLQEPVEQVRIPYVLPIPDPIRGYSDRPMLDDALFRRHLHSVGIERDRGKKVALVLPKGIHWSVSLLEAIRKETGVCPYLIQTADQRESIDNPGSLRILNPQGLMGMRN